MTDRKSGTEIGKFWKHLEDTEKNIVLYFVYSVPPVSVDTLAALSETSAVKVLNTMEKLCVAKLICEKKDSGRGVFFWDSASPDDFIDIQPLEGKAKKIIKRVIDYYSHSLNGGEESALILADLYKKLGNIEEGLSYLKSAADFFYRSDEKKIAASYYDLILDYFKDHAPEKDNVEIYLDSVLRNNYIIAGLAAADAQIALLSHAEKTAKTFEKWDFLTRIKVAFASALGVAGRHTMAYRYINAFQQLAKKIGNPSMIRMSALSMSEHYFYQGRMSDAISCYEEATGNLEEFGDDDASLTMGSLIGWCYVICGRISRGMGMINAVREKADLLNLQRVVLTADLMQVQSLLEMKRISEAEHILNSCKISLSSENASDTLTLWVILNCREFILSAREKYSEAFECHKKYLECLTRLRWVPKECPWHLEYLDTLESHGYSHYKVSYDTVLDQLINSNDLYQKGFALRYRALKAMKKPFQQGKVLSDLKNSEKYLEKSGALIELARTRIALGNYYLMKNDGKNAQEYFQKAWSYFSTVDRSLFPADLVAVMPREQKVEMMINRVVGINESLGVIHDTSSFLEKVIDVAMDFTMATRGAFFIHTSGEVKIVAGRNMDPAFLDTAGFLPIKETILSVVEEIAKPMAIGSKERASFPNERRHETRPASHICVPAKLGNHTYGYLYLDNRLGETPFSEDNLPFLSILCSQIAVGLSNIDLYGEMKKLKDRFEEEAIFYKQEMGIDIPLETIVGRSIKIQKMAAQIQQVAPTDSSVLILGETGVGKELVAKAIHSLSERKDGPFIPVNLAALPQELVASELFGHEKGAFTGANEKRKGRFELADGGTIFLDEIGDLPLNVQVKLLRVLQEGTFDRLGSSKQIKSNFRIIAATNKDLHMEVQKGSFRQDLYYRLNVFPIHIPPLRERREDIPLLARHFVDKYNRKLGKKIKRIPADEMKKLSDYHWPGNVRELEHAIERAVILSDGQEINFSSFEQTQGSPIGIENGNVLTLADMERDYIEKILNLTHWRVSGPKGAASLLGLNTSTLRFRIRKLGIQKPFETR